jgi:hypothetical protein
MAAATKATIKSYFGAFDKPTAAEFAEFIDSYTDGFIFSTDPTENDDSADGYVVGSLWTNDVSGDSFICVDDTAAAAVWKKISNSFFEFRDTFVNSANAAFWSISNNGTGAAAAAVVPGTGGEDSIGVVQSTTGTTATGRFGMTAYAGLFFFSSGRTHVYIGRIKIPTLSTATEEFVVRCGFIDVSTNAEPVDGAYFEYIRTTDVNWRYNTASNSTRTKNSSTSAVDTNWVNLKIVVDGTTPSARFYINNVLVGTITTNIPIGSGRETSIGFVIHKTVGLTARTLWADLMGIKIGNN